MLKINKNKELSCALKLLIFKSDKNKKKKKKKIKKSGADTLPLRTLTLKNGVVLSGVKIEILKKKKKKKSIKT